MKAFDFIQNNMRDTQLEHMKGNMEKKTYTHSSIRPNCHKHYTLTIPKGQRVDHATRICPHCECEVVRQDTSSGGYF